MDTDEVLGLLILVVGIPFAIMCAVMFFITWWKIFEKGGEEGWAIFVPFYNSYILGKVAGGTSFGIGVLIVTITEFFGFLIALVIDIAMDSDAVYTVMIFLFSLPWTVIRLIIAFKLGGKFGRGVWFRVFLAVPYINAFPHLYLALSKNCVYSEKPKEASVGLFIAIVLIPPIILLLLIWLGVLAAVTVPRFVATRTDAQVATARSDLASAMKAVVAKVFADNIDTTQSKAPNPLGADYIEWGEWIIEVAGLDSSRWKASGNGVYIIDNNKKKRKACYDRSGLPLLWIDTSKGNMVFNPSKLSDNYDKKNNGFCEDLRDSYVNSNGVGDRIFHLPTNVEF